MYLFNSREIRIHRGDTYDLVVTINENTNMDPMIYTLTDQDELYFAVMEPNQWFENAIIKKVLKNKQDHIKLEPRDTLCLFPGLYYYQIKLRRYNADSQTFDIITLNPKTAFWIEE